MKTYAIFLTLLYLYGINAEVVTDDDHDTGGKNSEKYILNSNKLHRRFVDDPNDDEWHVSHLRDVDFWSRKSSCDGDTFDDKARKYKRMLRNDGALVDFVSADPLPFNETDLIQERTCKESPVSDVKNESMSTNLNDNLTITTDENYESRSVTKEINTATTVDGKPAVSHANKNHRESSEEKSRRASEYMFSSAEYYDEVDDFDESSCPAAVEVITLELDQLRNYEIECEKILEWRSLE